MSNAGVDFRATATGGTSPSPAGGGSTAVAQRLLSGWGASSCTPTRAASPPPVALRAATSPSRGGGSDRMETSHAPHPHLAPARQAGGLPQGHSRRRLSRDARDLQRAGG